LKADVVVAAGENARVCLDALYRVHGAALGRVIAVCEAPSDARLLRELQGDRPELVVHLAAPDDHLAARAAAAR